MVGLISSPLLLGTLLASNTKSFTGALMGMTEQGLFISVHLSPVGSHNLGSHPAVFLDCVFSYYILISLLSAITPLFSYFPPAIKKKRG